MNDVVLWRRFNDVTVHNNTDVLLHDFNQKPPSTIVHTSTTKKKKQESSSSRQLTIRSPLRTVRACGERHRCVPFAHVLVVVVVVVAAAVAASEHFYTRVCFLCRPHWSCHCWHILFSTFLSRYFIRLNWCISFCFLFSFFSFYFIHSRLSRLLFSLPLSCSVPLSVSTHLRADYIKYTYDRQLHYTYEHQHSCLMYGSGLLLYLVQFSSVLLLVRRVFVGICASCLLYHHVCVCVHVLLV